MTGPGGAVGSKAEQKEWPQFLFDRHVVRVGALLTASPIAAVLLAASRIVGVLLAAPRTEEGMTCPWKEIPYWEYESHMTEIGQAQVLSDLTKHCLEKHRPERFALLGCATGNGLEHVDPACTRYVYAIDINPSFLARTRDRFANKVCGLETICLDIQNDELMMKDIDLFFVGLVLEYVDPRIALDKVIGTLSHRGIVVVVIQKNHGTSFVSKTKYKSLEKLGEISWAVDERAVDEWIRSRDLVLVKRDELRLTDHKSFVVVEYWRV